MIAFVTLIPEIYGFYIVSLEEIREINCFDFNFELKKTTSGTI